ncbi:phytoene desaturase family protein [Acidicapsa dinghuensis]|uniref:Phytoene desaturase family protein n=1 Tax=Acidicapsa dinghuensis TaxID=2218256 RepID=A0ABW1ENW6_9BACT|nr:NAD(P)/FAD-dependent oxidoreductase [Acidicapsa dinghuensis]
MAVIGYRQAKLEEAWDAIIIGSGIGGLTAAVLLAVHAGKRALVLERHYEAGGFTHTFNRPGYEWDVGLHYIGQMDSGSNVRRAFDHVTAGQVAWEPMPEVYDRVIVSDRRFDFVAGLERFREGMKGYFPGETDAIDRYIGAVMACNRASGLYYAEKAVPGVIAKLAGGLMRMPYLRWARRTTAEVMAGITKNPELAGVLMAQWGDYGLPPAESSFAVHATIAEHYFGGASYPVGGAGTIARAMAAQIQQRGGAVVTGAEVTEILLEQGKAAGVRMKDGREFLAPLVISDAGAVNTIERLLPGDLLALEGLRAGLRKLAPSTAHLSLYVGLAKTDAELGLKGTNLWVYPSLDHDANVRRFAKDVEAPFPGVYLSFPSSKDPSFQERCPGHSTVEAITMAPYAAFARWAESKWKRRGEDYDALKRRVADRLMAELERQVPAVQGNVTHAELSTPVTTRHFMNYGHGEIYGVAATPERFALRELGARTPVRGLFLTGQDVASLGVVGALYGGVVCASVAMGRNLISTVHKSRVG